MFASSTLILTLLLMQGLDALVLKDVLVPPIISIENEEVDPIKLDCIYVVDEDPTEFIVKWWKNDQLIYQWIHGNEPTAIPPYEDIVDTYEASSESFQQYRGIIINSPNLDSTGIYKCVVRSYVGKDFQEMVLAKKLQVVHTANSTLNVYHHRIENETHVECTVKDIFPEPIIQIRSDDDDPVQVISKKTFKGDDGFYNATTVAVVSDDDSDPDEYTCLVSFLGVNLTLTKTEGSGSAFTKIQPYVWLAVLMLLKIR